MWKETEEKESKMILGMRKHYLMMEMIWIYWGKSWLLGRELVIMLSRLIIQQVRSHFHLRSRLRKQKRESWWLKMSGGQQGYMEKRTKKWRIWQKRGLLRRITMVSIQNIAL